MKALFKKRTYFLISVIIAIAITSTSVAQVTIVNQYLVNITPTVPGAHLESGLANNSTVTESVNFEGSVSYINITEYFQLGGVESANISGMLKLPSSLPVSFGYLTNVSSFNGQKLVKTASIYSTAGNGSYTNDFSYNSSTGYSNNSDPIIIATNGVSSLGMQFNMGSSVVGGPYTWNLDFAINGYGDSSSAYPSIYTQYFVYIKVTTIVVA